MDREIKFRSWFENSKTMSLNFSLEDALKHEVDYVGDCVFMQYTGFKDRNGIEIYDGDIITFHSDDDLEDYGEEYWEVKFQNSTPVAWYSENEYRYLDRDIDSFSCEIPEDLEINVVGNIYENKELRND